MEAIPTEDIISVVRERIRNGEWDAAKWILEEITGKPVQKNEIAHSGQIQGVEFVVQKIDVKEDGAQD